MPATNADMSVSQLNRKFTDHVAQVSREFEVLHSKDSEAEDAIKRISTDLGEFQMEFKLHDLRETESRRAEKRLFEAWLETVKDLQKAFVNLDKNFTNFDNKLDKVIETQNASELEMRPIKGFKNWLVFSFKVGGVATGLVAALAVASTIVAKIMSSGVMAWATSLF